jgi:hypothetical protein
LTVFELLFFLPTSDADSGRTWTSFALCRTFSLGAGSVGRRGQ